MDVMVDEYATPTQDLCARCRQALIPRFNFMQELVIQEDPRETFLVCPYCDVEVSAR